MFSKKYNNTACFVRAGDSLDQNVNSVEVEEGLKGHMCENEDGKQVEMDARFPRRVAEEFEVQAWRSELWRCRESGTQADIRCLRRRKKGWRECTDRRRFRNTGPYMDAEKG